MRNQQIAARLGSWLIVALCFSSLLITGCGSTGVAASGTTPNNPGSSSVSVSPSSMAFGNVTVGIPSTKNFIVTNSGSSDLVVSSVSLSGAGFSLSPLTFPLTIQAGSSQTVSVTFTPQAAGAISGSASIVSNASATPTTVALTGSGVTTAVATLNVSPATLTFGSVNVGTSSSKNLTLTNPSSVVVNVSSVSVTGSGFSSSVQGPFTVPAASSSTVAILFQPKTAGSASGTVSIVSDAGNSPGTASLTGSGVGSGVQHSVDVSWNASTSTVAGYNVYRGFQPGGPYQLVNPSGQALAFTDSTVQSGITYYYVVTSLDSSGVESNFSNEAVAVVPTP